MTTVSLEEADYSGFPAEFKGEGSLAPVKGEENLALLPTPSKSYEVKIIDSQEGLGRLRKIVRDWIEVASGRLGHSRARKLDEPEVFESDYKKFEDYRLVKELLFGGIDRKSKEIGSKGETPEPNVIAILEDQNGVTQAVAASTIKAHQVYVNAILTAPWNLAMHGPNDPDHDSLCAKGAGTRLMAYNYQLAQKHGKPSLYLSPLEDVISFYQHIGMQPREEYYVYDIEEELPLALRKYV